MKQLSFARLASSVGISGLPGKCNIFHTAFLPQNQSALLVQA
jgi:hypothetical protein